MQEDYSHARTTVIIDRAALVEALARLWAIADRQAPSGIALAWADGELRLRAPDGSEDHVSAETAGTGRITAQTALLAEQVAALRGQRVRLAATEPIIITDPDDQSFLTLLSSMRIPAG